MIHSGTRGLLAWVLLGCFGCCLRAAQMQFWWRAASRADLVLVQSCVGVACELLERCVGADFGAAE
eukprot:5604583-Lingulodinium_polyedra.AAC.1